jgi:hypothetical protein
LVLFISWTSMSTFTAPAIAPAYSANAVMNYNSMANI